MHSGADCVSLGVSFLTLSTRAPYFLVHASGPLRACVECLLSLLLDAPCMQTSTYQVFSNSSNFPNS